MTIGFDLDTADGGTTLRHMTSASERACVSDALTR